MTSIAELLNYLRTSRKSVASFQTSSSLIPRFRFLFRSKVSSSFKFPEFFILIIHSSLPLGSHPPILLSIHSSMPLGSHPPIRSAGTYPTILFLSIFSIFISYQLISSTAYQLSSSVVFYFLFPVYRLLLCKLIS